MKRMISLLATMTLINACGAAPRVDWVVPGAEEKKDEVVLVLVPVNELVPDAEEKKDGEADAEKINERIIKLEEMVNSTEKNVRLLTSYLTAYNKKTIDSLISMIGKNTDAEEQSGKKQE